MADHFKDPPVAALIKGCGIVGARLGHLDISGAF